ncbi:MAG: DUF3185 domain-containing protein [Chthoniobacterales bacterium]
MRILGIVLIIAGILVLAVPYISFSHEKKILDVGPIHATKTEKETIPISPIVGIVVTLAGVAVVVAGAVKK